MGNEDLVNEERRQLLVLLLEEKGLSVPQRQEMAPRERGEDVPLSFAQQRLWFLDQLEEGSPFYNLAAAVRLQGALNVAALEQSLQQIVQRHEVLRTTFPFVSGRPVQCISTHLQVKVPFIDIAALSEKEREEQVRQIVQAEALLPFDLDWGPLLRAHLLRKEQEEHVLLVTMHHIVSDGWSLGVFMRELSALYASYLAGKPSPLPALPLQYADYALWQREHLQGEVLESQVDYWQAQLAGAPTDLMLPTDWPRPAVLTYRGRLHLFDLPKGLSEKLKALSRQRGVTLFMTLLAAWQVLLWRYSGQDDLLIGTPIANRTRAQHEGLIGCFVNTLVLRGDLSGNPSFLQLLERVREVTLQAYDYQDLPFEQLIEALRLQRDLSHTPLVQVMFVLQNAPMQGFELPGLHIEPLTIKQTTAKFELTLTLQETTQGLQAVLEYNCDLFEATTITRMAEHYQLLLEGIVADPGQHISSLQFLSAEQQTQVLTLCNPMPLASWQEECLHTLFEAQVQRTPDAVALVFEEAQLSYQALNERANRLASHLQAYGVGPEVRVGLCLERSLELMIGLLAILKAGGAYVPLDPAYPAERLAFLLADAQIQLLLTQERVRVQLPGSAVQVLYLDSIEYPLAGQSLPNPESGVMAQHLAYVIYTSGSTGTPKGVMVTHGNVSRLFDATQTQFHFSAQDIWAQFHSTAFDFSVWELWGALLHGGRLLLIPYWLSRSPQQFAELLIREQVTVLNQTPSAFRQLLSATETSHWQVGESLRLIIFGGEALDLASVQLWWQRHGEHGPQLVNMYGITETTVHVTAHELAASAISASQRNSIGRGLCDLQLYVLDAHLLPLPPGVPGELYVGGAGLARGYLSQPALTAERFVPHPFSQQPGRRLYKTGDVVRLLADGTLEYLGRNDAQVKVRGFRIELGEIEAALAIYEQVRDVVVLALEEGIGNKRLVAYVVPQPQQRPTVSQLRDYLQAKLPDYMLPSSFVMLDELPLTSHGKLDRRALPVPGPTRPELEEEYVPARSPQEEILVGIWSQVLGLEQVGIHDNFFALGGDSIRSIQVLALAQQRGLACSLLQLFRHQTIASLALALSQDTAPPATTLASQPLSLIPQDDRARLPEGVVDAYPLTLLQAGMFFHSAYQPERAIYHNVSSLHVQARFDLPALHSALQQVIARHPVLRTSFDLTSFQQPLQLVHEHVAVAVPCQDLCHLAPAAQEAVMARLLTEEKQRPFDWRQAPLLRLQVHRRSQDSFQLTMTEHHAILDGWSVASLLTELFERYLALLQTSDVPALEPPAVTFRDFVALEQEILASEQAEHFWTQHLADSTNSLVPRDNAGPAQNNEQPTSSAPQSRQMQVSISSELSADLHRLARATAVPLKSVLLAAHLNVLRVLGGQADVLTGLVSNGRPETADGERVLGLFLNTLPYRQQLTGGSWRELVQHTFEHEQALLPWRRYPLAQIQRQQGGQPLFETIFNFIHFHVYERLAQVPQLRVLGGESFARTNFLLVAHFSQTLSTGQVQLQLEYDEHQLSSQQMEAIAGYYQRTLTAMSTTPDAPYQYHSLLSQQEQQALLTNDAAQMQALPQQSLPHLFEAQVQRTPNAVALVFEEAQLSYQALNERANRLASHLQAYGVGPEVRVGLCLERSLELLIGLLAILKAGGAYVPLDPDYPAERLAFLLTNAQIQLLLTQERLLTRLPPHRAQVLCLDTAEDNLSAQNSMNPESGVRMEHLAYVIYTSGSTGTPKGVMVTHGNVSRLFDATQTQFHFSVQDVWTQFHSTAFDFSVWELWGALLHGGRLLLIPYWLSRSPHAFADILREQQVTVLNQTPSAFRHLLSATESAHWQVGESLRLIIFGGEALDLASVQLWWQRYGEHGPQLVNMYGITETTVHVTAHELAASAISASQRNSIGRGLCDLQLYVLDAHLQPLPPGVPGELYVGGAGLARGYLGQAALTAERFVPHPFSQQPGRRLYKTGDVVRLLADGTLEYLGRNDAQVKVRGFRIELGEIEATLLTYPAIQEVAVQAQGNGAGDRRLVAYVVSQPQQRPTVSQLRDYLQAKLPDYMLPATFVMLEELPLSPNGKLDRRRLPTPESARPELEEEYAPARSPQEEILVGIWSQVLGLEQVGIHDNFFALGGDSIRSIQVLALAQQRGLACSLLQLFRHQTIASLALALSQDTAPPATTLSSQPLSLLSQDDRARLPEGIVDAYPLTLLQAGMFFHSAYQPERAIYHNVSSLHVQARFDLSALHTALQQVIARHPVLRTSFDLTSFQQPLQLVHEHVEVAVPCQDLCHLAPAAQEAVMAQVLAEEKQRPFDWRQAPLLRLQVHRRSQDSFQLTMTEHHAILDGWSVASLLTELFERYLALLQTSVAPPLAPPSVAFRDFVALEQQALASEEAERFWSQHLAGSSSTQLPRGTNEPSLNASPQSRLVHMPISPQLSAALHHLARSTAVPLKSVLLAAHLNVLRVLGGQADVLTGLVSNGRPETADGERVLGLFLNTLPYRQQLRGGSWQELVQHTFEQEQDLLPWRRYPLAQIQRQQGGQPLFETAFNFMHFHVYERLAQVAHLRVLGGESFARTNFLLVANFSQTLSTGQVQLQLEYDEHQLSSQQIEAIAGYYSRTLAAMSSTPSARYQHYSLLSEQEQQVMLAEPSPQALPQQRLPHLFEAQVQRTPDAVALVFEDHLLTYCELNQQANQLAHHMQELGIGPEKLVGICLPRSLEQVISVLAVLKTGGAYVPIDPAYPSERLAFMLTDARVAVLLTQEHLLPLFQPVLVIPLPVVCLQAAAHQISRQPIRNLPCRVLPQQLAYVIYTSGSTGTPKGVMVTQAGLLNYLTWAAQTYQVAQGSGVLLHSSLSFDLTVTSLFTPLLVGQRLVLLPQDQGIERLAAALLQQQDWSLLKVTPAHLDSLRQLLTAEQMAGRIRTLVIGGEALDNEQIADWQQAAPSLRIYNEYGPSETVVGCSSYQVPGARQNGGAVPIGRPITNMSLYILDAHAQPVPVGVVGEVFIGGLGVGRGYLRRAALTAERFVPHPFSQQAGERLYRTGDLARYLPPRQGHLAEGTIEFVGRVDEQVKLRGYRIELGEIEVVLGQHPHVQDAAVVAREDEPGQKRLVAYLVMHPRKMTLMNDIRAYLKGRLPNYMIPSAFVEIEALPLTPNGKIDRAVLPRPENLHIEEQTRYVAPQTPLEQAIAAIWQAVLHIEHVGVDDNFFDLGGHSLLLIQAQDRLHTVLEEDISIIDLFDYPTIKALAQHIQQRHPPEAAFQESFERAARRRRTIPRRRQSKQHPGVQGQEGVQDA